MATPNTQMTLNGIARRLVNDGHIAEDEAVKAQEQSNKKKLSLVSYLVEKELVDGKIIASAAAEEFGIPVFDIEVIELESDIIKMVDEKLVRKHHALPLYKRGNRLFVAVSDPTNLEALDEIKFHVGANTEAVLVEEGKLKQVIEKAMAGADTSLADMSDDGDLDDLDIGAGDETEDDSVGETDLDDAPVVRFVNKVLLDAINSGASDIHFEPYEKTYRVRYRRDGVLKEVATPPNSPQSAYLRAFKGFSATGYFGTPHTTRWPNENEAFQEPGHRFSCQLLPDLVWRKDRITYS